MSYDEDFASIEEFGAGGGYFKPKDYANAAAILFRPTRFNKNGSQWKNSKGENKDILIADYHIFRTIADLKDGTPTEVLTGASCDSVGITGKGEGMLEKGKVAPVRIDKLDTGKGNPAWILVAPEPDVAAKVAEYWRGVKAAEQAAGDEIDALLNA